jgi:hypothetical protein
MTYHLLKAGTVMLAVACWLALTLPCIHSSSGNNSSDTSQYAAHVDNNASNNTAELSADGKDTLTALYCIK